jgi:hypothetical protein
MIESHVKMDVHSNEVTDIDRGPEILLICSVLVAVAVIIVALRLWVRIVVIHQLGADDYCISGALVRTWKL